MSRLNVHKLLLFFLGEKSFYSLQYIGVGHLLFYTQCFDVIFNLDQKFRSQNCLFQLLWRKKILIQAKNSSVNRVPFKIDFFTMAPIDFTTAFP